MNSKGKCGDAIPRGGGVVHQSKAGVIFSNLERNREEKSEIFITMFGGRTPLTCNIYSKKKKVVRLFLNNIVTNEFFTNLAKDE